jgi:hypothetical protein
MATPLLAGAGARLPSPTATRGASIFEPKSEMFPRLRAPPGCRVIFRNVTPPTGCLPDMTAPIRSQLQPETILEGQLVVCHRDRVDLTAPVSG